MKRTIMSAVLLAAFAATPLIAEDRTDLRVAAPWEISGADPATDGYVFLRMGVMETLVSTDALGNLQPGLATDWVNSDDGLSWSFKLRDATFHDGSLLSADTAATALQRAFENPGPFSKAPILAIESVDAQLQITLETPFAALPAVLAHSTTLIPASSAIDDDGKVTAAIGTGPFMVKELTPPQSLEITRFDGYWGTPAILESATYMASKRAETRALMAESNDADLVFTLDPSGYKRLGEVDTVITHSVAIPRVMLLKLNNTHPMLNDIKARQALSLAIDREGIAAGIIRFPDAAAGQLFPPALGSWHDTALEPLAYDLAQSSALLAELGWTAGDDGVLVRDGERFSLTMRTFPDRPELPLVATALQDQWRAIGVELKVSVSNYSEIPAGHQDGSLDVALFARNYGSTADPIGNILGDFGDGGGDWGAMNWQSDEVTGALTQIAASGDEQLRKPMIEQVATIIHNDLPMIPVLWYQHTVARSSSLENLVIDPLERSYGLDKVSWAK